MNKTLFPMLPVFPAAPAISKLSYLSRLNRLWEQMADDSVCILVSNPECKRSNDTHFPFRQSSEIVYLNGFPEPNSVLIVSKFGGKQDVIMLVQPKDKERETWDGIRQGVEGAKKNFFCSEAYPVGDLDKVVGRLIKSADNVYYHFGQNRKFDKQFRALWKSNKQRTLLDPRKILDEMRLFKSEEELAVLRHAGLISAEAHKQAMLACRPGIGEHQLQAVVEFVFRSAGSVAPAYGSIVASGNHACILHYVENNDTVQDGDLVLIDAGCEIGAATGGYAGDITRCFPANGKFSPAQRELYNVVLSAQLAAIKAAKPGARLIQVHQAAERVLRNGLRKLGIIPPAGKAKTNSLSLDDLMPHGTSHWLGLDVHDVGGYNDQADSKEKSADYPKRRVLEPGMVFTVEPGLYIDKNEKRAPARYRGIGIRIEDDLVITSDGNEVLTAAVPKTVEEIEALMDR